MHNTHHSTFVAAVLYSWPDPLCLVLHPKCQPWCKSPVRLGSPCKAVCCVHACGHCTARRTAADRKTGAEQLQNPGLPEVCSCPREVSQSVTTTFARHSTVVRHSCSGTTGRSQSCPSMDIGRGRTHAHAHVLRRCAGALANAAQLNQLHDSNVFVRERRCATAHPVRTDGE